MNHWYLRFYEIVLDHQKSSLSHFRNQNFWNIDGLDHLRTQKGLGYLCHLCLIYPKYFKVFLAKSCFGLSSWTVECSFHCFATCFYGGWKERNPMEQSRQLPPLGHQQQGQGRQVVLFLSLFFWSARTSCTFVWSVCKNFFSPSFLSPPFPSSPPFVPSSRLLQIIMRRCRPLTNDHLSPPSP